MMYMYNVKCICGRVCIYDIYDSGAWNTLDDDDCSYIMCLYIYGIIWEVFLLHML